MTALVSSSVIITYPVVVQWSRCSALNQRIYIKMVVSLCVCCDLCHIYMTYLLFMYAILIKYSSSTLLWACNKFCAHCISDISMTLFDGLASLQMEIQHVCIDLCHITFHLSETLKLLIQGSSFSPHVVRCFSKYEHF